MFKAGLLPHSKKCQSLAEISTLVKNSSLQLFVLGFHKKNQLIERWTEQVADEGLIFVDKQWSKRERLFSFIYRNTFGVLLSVFFLSTMNYEQTIPFNRYFLYLSFS